MRRKGRWVALLVVAAGFVALLIRERDGEGRRAHRLSHRPGETVAATTPDGPRERTGGFRAAGSEREGDLVVEVRSESSEAISGAAVKAYRVAGHPSLEEFERSFRAPAQTGRTAADGTCRLHLPAGDWAFVAAAPGFSASGWYAGQMAPGGKVWITLARGAVGRWTVVDPAGDPVEGATVLAYGWAGGGHSLLLSTKTGRDGGVSLRLPQSSALAIRAAGYVAQEVRPALEHQGSVVLRKSFSLKGRILDSREKGVFGAALQLMPRGSFPRTCRSAEDGSFCFDSVGVADFGPDHRLEVFAEGFLARGIPLEHRTGNLILHLVAAAWISGEVLDVDGRPAAGAEIDAEGRASPWRGTVTNAHGRFTMGGVSPGKVTLVARSGSRRARAQIPLKEGEHRSGVVLRLEEKGVARVSVLVCGPEGGVLPGDREISVQVNSEAGPGPWRIPAGEAWEVDVVKSRAETWWMKEPPLGPGPHEVRVVVYPDRRTRGRVVDQEEHPLAGLLVLAEAFRGSSHCREERRTDAQGGFELNGLPPGRIHLAISSPSLATLVQRTVEAPEADPARLDPIRLDLLSIRGRVTDSTGKPLRSAHLQTNPSSNHSFETDARGGFEFRLEGEHLPKTILLSCAGFGARAVAVRALDLSGPLVFALPAEGSVVVRRDPSSIVSYTFGGFVDPESGAFSGGPRGMVQADADAPAKGPMTLRMLPPGRVGLRFHVALPDGKRSTLDREVTVLPGQVVDLDLTR